MVTFYTTEMIHASELGDLSLTTIRHCFISPQLKYLYLLTLSHYMQFGDNPLPSDPRLIAHMI